MLLHVPGVPVFLGGVFSAVLLQSHTSRRHTSADAPVTHTVTSLPCCRVSFFAVVLLTLSLLLLLLLPSCSSSNPHPHPYTTQGDDFETVAGNFCSAHRVPTDACTEAIVGEAWRHYAAQYRAQPVVLTLNVDLGGGITRPLDFPRGADPMLEAKHFLVS